MVGKIQPVGPLNIVNKMVKVFANTGNTLLPNLGTPLGARDESRISNPNSRSHATKRGLRVPNPNSRGHARRRGFRYSAGLLNSTEGWGPKEGGNATSPLHSRGSPTTGTKLEVKTYARGHNDAPSISKYVSLV